MCPQIKNTNEVKSGKRGDSKTMADFKTKVGSNLQPEIVFGTCDDVITNNNLGIFIHIGKLNGLLIF
jgi:hypothetical protein